MLVIFVAGRGFIGPDDRDRNGLSDTGETLGGGRLMRPDTRFESPGLS